MSLQAIETLKNEAYSTFLVELVCLPMSCNLLKEFAESNFSAITNDFVKLNDHNNFIREKVFY